MFPYLKSLCMNTELRLGSNERSSIEMREVLYFKVFGPVKFLIPNNKTVKYFNYDT